MANRYWVGSGTNWSSTDWSTTSGGASGSAAPTAADDVFFDGSSGNCTIAANAVCRSLNCTGYTGTLTHGAFSVDVGDGTAGAGNVALKLVAGMTYTLSGGNSSRFYFSSVSTTQQTVDYGGKTCGNVDFRGSTGSYLIVGDITSAGGILSVQEGAVDFNGYNVTVGTFSSSTAYTRSITLGSGTFTLSGSGNAWFMATTNLTFPANTAIIKMTSSGAGQVTFAGGGLTYGGTVEWTALYATASYQNASGSVGTLKVTVAAASVGAATLSFQSNSNQTYTVTSALTLTGYDAKRPVRVIGATTGSYFNLDVTGATITGQYANFRDVKFTYGANLDLNTIFSSRAGDMGGNTIVGAYSLTFTSPTTNYWVGGTGNWSTTAEWASSSGGTSGTGRVPLPQDDVVFDGSSFSAGSQTVTMNVLDIGTDVDISAATNAPTFSLSGPPQLEIIGSLYFPASFTWTNTVANGIIWRGRGAATFDSNGESLNCGITIDHPGGTVTLASALTIASNRTLTLTRGTLDTDGYSLTIGTLEISASSTRALDITNSTVTLTATGAATPWSSNVVTDLTLTTTGSTVYLSTTDAGAKTLNFGGTRTLNNLKIAGGSGAGAVTFTYGSTWTGTWEITGERSIVLTQNTTHTFNTAQTGLGNGTSIVTFTKTAGATDPIISCASGTFSWDYISLTNIDASTGATFYAGSHSTDGGGNANWIFTAPPASTYTASAAATTGGAAAAGTATHDAPVFSGSGAATSGGAASSGTAEHDAPVYTASGTATAGGAASAASAAYAASIHTASAAATVGGASGAATAEHDAPVFSASAAMTSGGGAAAVTGTHVAPVFTATAAAATAGAVAAGTATFTAAGATPPAKRLRLAEQGGLHLSTQGGIRLGG